jgi:hypothetical protein
VLNIDKIYYIILKDVVIEQPFSSYEEADAFAEERGYDEYDILAWKVD